MNKWLIVGIAFLAVILGVNYFLNSSSQNLNQVACSGKAVPSLTEGPYYKTNSPRKTRLREAGVSGEPLNLTGYVLDTNCQPISGAWLDFWQADGNGVYDNAGYKLRGHQFTEASGKYSLETVVPGEYPGRTPHIHVKVRARDTSPVITSQLFMPNKPQNQQDAIFDPSLIMEIKDGTTGKVATYNFVISR